MIGVRRTQLDFRPEPKESLEGSVTFVDEGHHDLAIVSFGALLDQGNVSVANVIVDH